MGMLTKEMLFEIKAICILFIGVADTSLGYNGYSPII